MNKKLAVVVCGWHISDYFYKQMTEQIIPKGQEVEYFCVAHRDPKHAIGEKNIDKNSKNLLSQLDYFYYKNIATISSMESYGWKYILKPNTLGDWGVYNQWIEDYNYKDYDMFLLTGDDNFFINEHLFTSVLGGELEEVVSNNKINGVHTTKNIKYNYDDWLVLSNGVHRGRGAIRGSLEFIKREMLDIIGGKFDFSTCNSELRKGLKDSPKDYMDLDNWNNQVFPFLETIGEKNLYSKIHFLSSMYRASSFCIEGERGYFSNNNCAPYAGYYSTMVNELNERKLLNKFLTNE